MLRIYQLEEEITELEREKAGDANEGTVAASDGENPEEDMITGEPVFILTREAEDVQDLTDGES